MPNLPSEGVLPTFSKTHIFFLNNLAPNKHKGSSNESLVVLGKYVISGALAIGILAVCKLDDSKIP